MELADVADSKSVGSNTVGVQVPLPAPVSRITMVLVHLTLVRAACNAAGFI